ncbi:MAG TPA: DMT family transporter [Methanocorpusculum sp.]|nr:DMT family transporter [Methanocorpusculum sp.]
MSVPALSNPVKNTMTAATICAVLAAVCNGLETPLKKLFMDEVDTFMIITFIFLGTALGMVIISLFCRKTPLIDKTRHIRKSDTPMLLAIIAITFAANIFLCLALKEISPSTVSVLMSLEMVATVLISIPVFKEKVSKRLWIGIVFIFLGSIALSFSDASSFALNFGAVLALLAAVMYGIRANCMKKVSGRNPTEVTIVRGAGVVLCALPVGILLGESIPSLTTALLLMLTGLITSGCVMLFTLYAQRQLGAAKTGAIYGIYPLVGAIASFIIFSETPTVAFFAALILILPGLFFASTTDPRDNEQIESMTPDYTQSPFFSMLSDKVMSLARNYVTALCLLLLAVPLVILLFTYFDDTVSYTLLSFARFELSMLPLLLPSVFLMLCSIILLIMRRRALFGAFFLVCSCIGLISAIFYDTVYIMVVSATALFLFALLSLLSGEKSKYLIALLSALIGLITILIPFKSSEAVNGCLITVLCVVSFLLGYLALVSVSERQALPLKKYITADGKYDFIRYVPPAAYLFASIAFAINLCSKFMEMGAADSIEILTAELILGIMLALLGVLMLLIGKMRLNGVVFIGMAFGLLMNLSYAETVPFIVPLIFFVLGLFVVTHRSQRLLMSILFIDCGFVVLLKNMSYEFPNVSIVLTILLALCICISLYLSFAIVSEKPNLPLF